MRVSKGACWQSPDRKTDTQTEVCSTAPHHRRVHVHWSRSDMNEAPRTGPRRRDTATITNFSVISVRVHTLIHTYARTQQSARKSLEFRNAPPALAPWGRSARILSPPSAQLVRRYVGHVCARYTRCRSVQAFALQSERCTCTRCRTKHRASLVCTQECQHTATKLSMQSYAFLHAYTRICVRKLEVVPTCPGMYTYVNIHMQLSPSACVRLSAGPQRRQVCEHEEDVRVCRQGPRQGMHVCILTHVHIYKCETCETCETCAAPAGLWCLGRSLMTAPRTTYLLEFQ
jgi:hypothetical protein